MMPTTLQQSHAFYTPDLTDIFNIDVRHMASTEVICRQCLP